MSTKITLESRQKLPSKVQDVICDSALIIQHATSASGSSEMLMSSMKQFCAAEQSIGNTASSLNKMDGLLDAMLLQCDDVENKIGVVSDALETLQTIERSKYFTEEGTRPNCESDVDSNP
ncbi:unnamed protein product [Cylicocyclus nassatus]|uniref:BLOC-1-related complex subunit 7 n=1 Tax=Cylicocyclus nassatus TaxID=53992 RepID=A0AA36HFZ8_CYLNA|nr:unnamed protein product [Cylicocyclus nassatus]